MIIGLIAQILLNTQCDLLHGNFASMDALTDYYALLDGLNNRFYSQKRLDGLIYIGAGQDISPISKAMYDEKNSVTPEKKEYIRDIHKEYQIHKDKLLSGSKSNHLITNI